MAILRMHAGPSSPPSLSVPTPGVGQTSLNLGQLN